MPQSAREINFDTPVLKVSGLETKFDTSVMSNSLVVLIGDYLEARILQQLHYWTVKEYGIVLKGARWIYKPVRELLIEVLIGFTSWQIRKALSSLVGKELLFREHLFKEHHGHNFAPKNRTYYYSINYQKLQELANPENAESIENVRFVSHTKQICESSANPFCEKAKNYTDSTSIENNSKNKSHPTLPCVSVKEKTLNKKKDSLRTQIEHVLARPTKKKVNAVVPKAIEKEASSAINEKIVKENNLDDSVTKPKIQKTKPGTKPKRKNLAPWKDEGEFKRFYRALIAALPIVANSHSPQGLAQVIIRQLRSGIPHSYWDDFKAGLPIGSATKPEWEVEPGVPYPMFVEYLTEKIKKGNNTATDEQTRNEVFRLLNQPRQAKAFWSQFKRSLVNVSQQVERDLALGVSHPHTPVWTRERIEPSLEDAANAGQKIMGVNDSAGAAIEASSNSQLAAANQKENSLPPTLPDPVTTSDPWTDDVKLQLTMREMLSLKLGSRNLKGFVKKMPQVSPAEAIADERVNKKPKMNISRMSMAEINESLQDPILRKELMPQLWPSDYQLITDELGQIIAVERSS
ncbi:hypothetical protein Xen7305DRAFT_00031980 [Xenococcus sp. PCC 7305]|uniref:hypothetical protein n=1 Tax=Xenococcus sp. PCC 7305 TaxID=102125 RepID=UPI0002AC6993|nr:hypothetical protein [Xenococcus sp. PCC 7305]ELS03474.1 hypothetical protein Xen7305DRAFT_00031980 [Xenococcus sp. PCC 7305]